MSNINKINENTWYVDDNNVRFFILAGTKEALVIDSGMTIKNIKAIVSEVTDLPVKLINTHADIDHVGANDEFDIFYMHPSEASNYYNSHKKAGDFIPVSDGQIIDLGDRTLEIVLIPGHTPGSIGILDVNNKMIFTGDPVQDGMIFMFGVQREIHAYLKSLEKLDSMKDRFDNIYPSHGSLPVKPDIINKLYDAASGILAGKYEYNEIDMFGNKVKKYDTGVASFLME